MIDVAVESDEVIFAEEVFSDDKTARKDLPILGPMKFEIYIHEREASGPVKDSEDDVR